MSSEAIRLLAYSSTLAVPVSIIVKSALLVGVGLAVVRLQKRASATRRALTLQLTVVSLLLLPLLSAVLPALRVPLITEATAVRTPLYPAMAANAATMVSFMVRMFP